MLNDNIALSSSNWASPSLLVDKSPRFCTGYPKVNKATKPVSYPDYLGWSIALTRSVQPDL